MKKPPFRFWIGLMVFFTAFTSYMLRANISISVIGMVASKERKYVPACKRYKTTNITTGNETVTPDSDKEKFDWGEYEISYIFAGYYYGYVVSLIPAGFLGEVVGPWHVIMWSSVAQTILTVLTPVFTMGGYFGLTANRILIGFCGGAISPAVNTLVANWAPPKEKGKFMAAVMGTNLGGIFAFAAVGIVTHYWGWAWGFYFLVIVLIPFCICFFFFVADDPSKSRWTSQQECDFILEEQEGHLSPKKKVAPYRRMLTSVPFMALCVAQFGHLWCINLFLIYTPKYLSETLGYKINESGGLAALPYVAKMFFSIFFGQIGDLLRREHVMSVIHIRKFFIIFSHFIPGVCFFLIRAVGCDLMGAMLLLITNQGFNGAAVVSHLINTQDLSPNFAGTIYGLINLFGMTTGAIIPVIVGAVDSRGLDAAALICTIGGVVMVVTGVVFIFFGSGQAQPWNEIKEEASTSQERREES